LEREGAHPSAPAMAEPADQLASARGQPGDLAAALAQVSAELGRARAELAALHGDLAAARERAAVMAGELTATRHQLVAEEAERARSDSRAATLAHALEGREIDLRALWSSTSWRLTYPLRRAATRMPWLGNIGRSVLEAAVAAVRRRPGLHHNASSVEADPHAAATVTLGDVASGEEHDRSPRGSLQYSEWVGCFDTLDSSDEALIRLDVQSFKTRPRISVVLLPSQVGRSAFASSLAALSVQLYREFEIIVPDSDTDVPRDLPEELEDKFRVVRSAPAAAEAVNAALGVATGELFIVMDAGDALPPHALYLAARTTIDEPNLQLIYNDEDELLPDGGRARPFFKSAWNPELILAFNYIGKAFFCRMELVRSIGGARAAAGAAWRWDLILRAAERTAPATIGRIPFVLYHEAEPDARRRREIAAARAAVDEALARRNQAATLVVDRGWLHLKRRLPDPPPHVTIIVPTRDRCDVLRPCIEGLLRRTAYPSFDVMIVDNCSREEETIGYLRELGREPRVSIITYQDEFNFARMHNKIVPSVRGDLVALLNNDVEVIGADWLEIMVGHALDPQVGVVGAKLYFPDGKIQHAGVVIGLGGAAGHLFHCRDRVDIGPAALLMASQDVSAVTAACMVLRRSVFAEVGGFDEALAVDFNDIDYCLNVRQRGYRVIWAADAELYHLEGATRGTDHTSPTARNAARHERFLHDKARFMSKWRCVVEADPYYNPNLTLASSDRSLSVPPRVVRPWRGERHLQQRLAPRVPSDAAPVERAPSAELEKGVALIGLLKAEVGLGQAARAAGKALEAVGYPHSRHAVTAPGLFHDNVQFHCETSFASTYDTALIYLNADTLTGSSEIIPRSALTGKRRIGFWHWELPMFPHVWTPAIDLVDEIWTPSRFVAESIGTATTKPIRIVPHAVSVTHHPARMARNRLGLPDGGFLFLSVFDTNSYLARKNPEAVVRAFIDAFPDRTQSSPLLIIKCHGTTGRGPRFESLLQSIASDHRITLIDRVFSSEEMSLLFASCDALVSLHRSEGYGLNLAEAMAHGKLAIATGFSGNTEFMTDRNSILVPYAMKAVGRDEYVCGAGQWWAEPDHAASVEAMRLAVTHPSLVAKLSDRARQDIERDNSYERVGRLLVAALEGRLANVQDGPMAGPQID
jgi:GT2 family glycosyltransferase/glycosyltransferase involved in cell wall biosynthesis